MEGGGTTFNPCARKYRSCCCHVKTFTIFIGILELIFMCIGLASNVGQSAMRCDPYDAEGHQPHELEYNRYKHFDDEEANGTAKSEMESMYSQDNWRITEMMCRVQRGRIVWSLADIVVTASLLYGIKVGRWGFLVPHLVLRSICLLSLALGFIVCAVVSVFLLFASDQESGDFMTVEYLRMYMFILTIVLGVILAFNVYIFVCMVRCCQFLKGMAESRFAPNGDIPSTLIPMVTVMQGGDGINPPQVVVYPQQSLTATADQIKPQAPPPAYSTVADAPYPSKVAY